MESSKDVPQKHVSFRVLVLTFHHQFSLIDLVASNQVPNVRLHQICGQKELLLLGSRVLRGFHLCREIKNCAVWQTSDKVLETDGFCVRNAAQSFLLHNTPNKRSTLCDPDNTFHTNAFNGRFSFLNQYTCQSKKNTTFHSRTLGHARFPIPAPFTCCPNVSKVGLDEFLCDVFEVTVLPQCTPCMTLPSHGDAVSQLRPPIQHCTERYQDLRERIHGFDASHCELQCIHQRFHESRQCQESFEPHELLTV